MSSREAFLLQDRNGLGRGHTFGMTSFQFLVATYAILPLMKINSESTIFQRLCVLIGSLVAAIGFLMVAFFGFISASGDGVLLFVGLGLLVLGLLIAHVKGLADTFLAG